MILLKKKEEIILIDNRSNGFEIDQFFVMKVWQL